MTGIAGSGGTGRRFPLVLGLILACLVGAPPRAAAQTAVGAGFDIGTSVLVSTAGGSQSGAAGLQAMGTFEVIFELDPAFHVAFATENPGASGTGEAPTPALVAASLVRFRFRDPASRVGVAVGLGAATVQGTPGSVPIAELGLRLRAARFQREVYASEVGIDLAYRFMQVPGTPAMDLSGIRAGISVGIRF